MVYGRLSKDRINLWEAVITAQIGFLSAIALPASVSCEDFLSIVWAINTMAALGEEFCGSDSTALRNCLVMKSKEYFNHLHGESLQVLRLMIDSESWQRVNVNLEDMGGVLGVLKKNIVIASRQRREKGSSDGVKPAPVSVPSTSPSHASSSLLISFITHGNPFSAPEEAVVRLSKIVEGEDTDTSEGAGTGTGTGVSPDPFNGALALGSDLFTTREALEQCPRTHVLTQTCLNGLARYTGRYLQLMYLLPGTAPDIFTALCALYDYYLCAVYCGFVPVERQTILKGSGNIRPAAAAPDRKQEFEVTAIHLHTLNISLEICLFSLFCPLSTLCLFLILFSTRFPPPLLSQPVSTYLLIPHCSLALSLSPSLSLLPIISPSFPFSLLPSPSLSLPLPPPPLPLISPPSSLSSLPTCRH